MSLDPHQLPALLNITEHFLYERARAHPRAIALYYRDQTYTYEQVAENTARAAAAFRELGIEAEQRILLLLPDSPEFVFAWFAAVQIGAVVSAASPDLKNEELAYYLNYTRAKAVVATGAAAAAIQASRSDIRHLKCIISVALDVTSTTSFHALLAQQVPDYSVAPTHRDDTAVWLYTSGSTGFPKAAVHKQHDFFFNAYTYGLPIVGYRRGDICLAVPKLAFGYALGSNLLFPFLAGASVVLFPEKATPELLCQLVAKHRPTVLTAVPTALNSLVNSPEARATDFSSLRVTLSAGEALPAELYQRWKALTRVEILDGIGSAEMFHIFITNRLNDVKVGSLGRVVEGYEAKVCDDEGHTVAAGEVGTLWVRGDSMALEYWQEHEKSKATFRGDWCVSADKFQCDELGYYYFCGRGDDMLKVGGKWLSPVEVENALLTHPAVKEAAVVGFTDGSGLQKPKAFVAVHQTISADQTLSEALKAHVRNTLEPYKAPREVVFVPALPRNERGKIMRGQLGAS